MKKKLVDLSDVRFNLSEQTYEPYRKPNNKPIYIDIQSNRPQNIIVDIPNVISKRLTILSCNKNVFGRNVIIYRAALKNSCFDGKITDNDQSEKAFAFYVNIEEGNQPRKCKGVIIW